MNNSKKNNTPKFLVSGYYGHDNFGDEAILKVITSELKKNFKNPRIIVLSNNPNKTKSTCQVDSTHKYNIFSVFHKLFTCDVFISGGGSLLQDVTSFKSLLYYLSLLLIAKIFNKKTFICAQGIGPLKGKLARRLTTFVLKKVDFITVRDSNSLELLSELGVQSTITADPVWTIERVKNTRINDELRIGIQLRRWNSLTETKLNILADAIISNFNDTSAQIELISLQSASDIPVMEQFGEILKQKGLKQKLTFLFDSNSEEIISHISNLDLLIAMRYHAGLIAAKHCVPFLALSYDPKVRTLAKETYSPFISINELDFYRLDKAIKYLNSEKISIKEKLKSISSKNTDNAKRTMMLLKDLFESNCF